MGPPSASRAARRRAPQADPRASIDVEHYVRTAKIAERGKLDAMFLAVAALEVKITPEIEAWIDAAHQLHGSSAP
ncbi:hypothetical protein QO058_11075 [Bosea vestrisii]|uniref:hypothetical protein n=1 Tax=Bosea vestrisii TaxID=151416 RepID=UPI0024E02F70|nr:hypothetical protein [Bosea vestrisii]WID98731.1 hypothetical protein QO058_11075 [Bosea vestrisii]